MIYCVDCFQNRFNCFHHCKQRQHTLIKLFICFERKLKETLPSLPRLEGNRRQLEVNSSVYLILYRSRKFYLFWCYCCSICFGHCIYTNIKPLIFSLFHFVDVYSNTHLRCITVIGKCFPVTVTFFKVNNVQPECDSNAYQTKRYVKILLQNSTERHDPLPLSEC